MSGSGWIVGYEEGKDARRAGAERDQNPYDRLVGNERDERAQAGWTRGWEEMDWKLTQLDTIDLAM